MTTGAPTMAMIDHNGKIRSTGAVPSEEVKLFAVRYPQGHVEWW